MGTTTYIPDAYRNYKNLFFTKKQFDLLYKLKIITKDIYVDSLTFAKPDFDL